LDEAREHWRGEFRRVAERNRGARAHLTAEDQIVQSMADASPTKWHRAHVTWFFETSCSSRTTPATRLSTSASVSVQFLITSPPARATRARSAA